ncbi:hypothetical protein CLV84_3737 [Neolewinella xylanilytica]|uniref:Lipocalin-like domain-containing protein n=1 Tax=Neolewinella xylanilytica TaxID=1514080 RepID=A0A2S6I0W1_9BACT|nr:hypothetical protein [Neolewinella xylanilytica]PPK84575.1 hypothetical protein CLV84_3737 [Neolewinella xylanilytica]
MPHRLLPLLALLFIACSKDDSITPDEILGTWKLTEVYLDPGDGSGSFEPADYEREITFYADSTYRTSRQICTILDQDEGPGTGRYSPGEDVIFPTECRIGAEYTYSVDGRELTISYLCFEGCAERYEKLRN